MSGYLPIGDYRKETRSMAAMFRVLGSYKDDDRRTNLIEVTYHVPEHVHKYSPYAPIMKGGVSMEWLILFIIT